MIFIFTVSFACLRAHGATNLSSMHVITDGFTIIDWGFKPEREDLHVWANLSDQSNDVAG